MICLKNTEQNYNMLNCIFKAINTLITPTPIQMKKKNLAAHKRKHKYSKQSHS